MTTNRYNDAMNRIGAAGVYGKGFAFVGEPELAAVEARLGYSLPADYREFIRSYGLASGTGNVRFRNMDDPSHVESSVDVFYGIRPDVSKELLGHKDGFGDLLPAHILPVGSGSGGQFCLSLAGTDLGCVYWWSPHGGAADAYDEMELVARSFDGFVNSLILADDDYQN